MRMRIYQLLVNRVPYIQKEYHSLRRQKSGFTGRVYAWIVLLWMNLRSPFCKKKYEEALYYPDQAKKMPQGRSESSISLRESSEEFATRLMQYDVISFDVFDTLVLRPFSSPTDLFFPVGDKLNYLDFERIRREMEWRARQKAKEQTGSYEVTLEQIYEEMEAQAGIPKEKGMHAEIETELELCFGNPYMLEVFQYLQNCGKTIICTSDMYLPEAVIRQMVEKSGFAGISQYFISCEQGASKGNGSLFEKVKETYGRDKKYVHVGDNPISDVEWSRKSGFDAEAYQNVNVVGMKYRSEDMSAISGSMYRGIVNAHIHNGLKCYSQEYELGYIYGGLFVLGYCQWIHEYVRTHEIDKILFLSRDGDILNQVYTKLYLEESGDGKTEYVYWSRLAATKMSARYFKYDYFRRFLDHKVNQNYTVEAIFKSMEIEDMLGKLCKEKAVSADTKLTDQNVGAIKQYLIEHWEQVLMHYEEQLEAGKMYYREVLAGCKHVVAVDIGWAGSGAVALNHVVNDIWKLDCEVIGLLAGTNTIHNAEPNMSEPQLQSGKLVSFLYSQGNNRDIWKWHDAAKGHNLGMELLCSSVQGSLKKFELDEIKGYRICLKEPDVDAAVVEEIQKGILEFVNDMLLVLGKQKLQIPECDIYSVLRMFLKDQRSKNMQEVGI